LRRQWIDSGEGSNASYITCMRNPKSKSDMSVFSKIDKPRDLTDKPSTRRPSNSKKGEEINKDLKQAIVQNKENPRAPLVWGWGAKGVCALHDADRTGRGGDVGVPLVRELPRERVVPDRAPEEILDGTLEPLTRITPIPRNPLLGCTRGVPGLKLEGRAPSVDPV